MEKSKVYKAYEIIHQWFEDHRTKDLIEADYLNFIQSHLPRNSHLLDLGCGTAEPIAKFFIENGHRITGVDGSHNMIARCQKKYPEQIWITADMCHLPFQRTFHGIIAWHSLFHLSHTDQIKMFQVFHDYLKPNGLLIFTSGINHEEEWVNNGGEMLYQASLSINEYQALLKQHGFDILLHKQMDPMCGQATVWIASLHAFVSPIESSFQFC